MMMYPWGYDESLTAEDFIKRLAPLIDGPWRRSSGCDGDMWLSDYSKLTEANARISRVLEEIKKREINATEEA
jgi:hypothetical protein